jgi:hypothetical protein
MESTPVAPTVEGDSSRRFSGVVNAQSASGDVSHNLFDRLLEEGISGEKSSAGLAEARIV